MKRWDRRLWGVIFTGSREDDEPMLIGALWARSPGGEPYKGEPTRPLLFCARRDAREWCAERNAEWEERPDLVSKWRVRPIRVRELVTPC